LQNISYYRKLFNSNGLMGINRIKNRKDSFSHPIIDHHIGKMKNPKNFKI